MNLQNQQNSMMFNNNPSNEFNHPDEVNRVHRTTSLDNLGGGFLLKRNQNLNPLDSLGGGYLLSKRNRESPRASTSVLDTLGGGYLL
jgi:hypothetical protein